MTICQAPHGDLRCSLTAGHSGPQHCAFSAEGELVNWGEAPEVFVENTPEVVTNEDRHVMTARQILEGAHSVLANRGYTEGEIAVIDKIEQDVTKAGRFFWDLLASMAEDKR